MPRNPDWQQCGGGCMDCTDGKRGSWQTSHVLVTAKAMSLELAAQLTGAETCTIPATPGGSWP